MDRAKRIISRRDAGLILTGFLGGAVAAAKGGSLSEFVSSLIPNETTYTHQSVSEEKPVPVTIQAEDTGLLHTVELPEDPLVKNMKQRLEPHTTVEIARGDVFVTPDALRLTSFKSKSMANNPYLAITDNSVAYVGLEEVVNKPLKVIAYDIGKEWLVYQGRGGVFVAVENFDDQVRMISERFPRFIPIQVTDVIVHPKTAIVDPLFGRSSIFHYDPKDGATAVPMMTSLPIRQVPTTLL